MFDRSKRKVEQELDAELAHHIESQVSDYVARGMTAEEARRQVHLAFGIPERIKEECRDVQYRGGIERFVQDLKYGIRGLTKSPFFAGLVIVTMALGIGASTAMFSVIRAVFLKPMPFPQSERIVTVWESDPARGITQQRVTGPNFVDWEAQTGVFESMGLLPNWDGANARFNIGGGNSVERVEGVYASSGLFRVLGVPPLLGQTLAPEDDKSMGRRRVVLSYSYWKDHFLGDPAVLGKTLDIDTFRGGQFTVAGVMPQGFDFPQGAKVWLSLGDWGDGPLPPLDAGDRGRPWHAVFARLKPGVTPELAATELTAIARRISERHPDASRVAQVKVVGLRESLVGEHRLALSVLAGAVGCVLLIVCANVANLLLSRGVGRRKELLTRMALGATAWRLARQLILESMVLCSIGSVGGLLAATWAQELFIRFLAGRVPLIEQTRTDFVVFAFAALVTILSSIVCALGPMMELRTLDWRTRGQTESATSKRLRHALVISEVTIAVILVSNAALLVRTLSNLQAVDIGFQKDRLLTVSLDVTTGPLRGRGNAARFLEELIPRVATLPGVRKVGAATGVPLETGSAEQAITKEGQPVLTAAESPRVINTAVTPNYFSALGLALQKGRFFSEADTANGKLVAIVNETAARRYWPSEDPIGKRFAIGSRERFNFLRLPSTPGGIEWREIVGVVSDMRSTGFGSNIEPEAFFSYKQFPVFAPTLMVRTDVEPTSLAGTIRGEINTLNSGAVITRISSMNNVAEETLAVEHLRATVVASFSALALLLGMLGIYGVLSYTVTQRTQEIGIRMAVGANRGDVVRMVIGHALLLSTTGILLGLGATVFTARWIRSFLFGVQPLDLWTMAGSCMLLLIISMGASWYPAWRATRVSPTVVLRAS